MQAMPVFYLGRSEDCFVETNVVLDVKTVLNDLSQIEEIYLTRNQELI